jgi:hypothetical protein
MCLRHSALPMHLGTDRRNGYWRWPRHNLIAYLITMTAHGGPAAESDSADTGDHTQAHHAAILSLPQTELLIERPPGGHLDQCEVEQVLVSRVAWWADRSRCGRDCLEQHTVRIHAGNAL